MIWRRCISLKRVPMAVGRLSSKIHILGARHSAVAWVGFVMTSDEKQIAHEVHERLLATHLASGDKDLARAAQIATIDPNATAPRDHARFVVCVAIERLQDCIEEGGGAADREQLLTDAIRAAEQWVRRC
jgi:hypothetical protein